MRLWNVFSRWWKDSVADGTNPFRRKVWLDVVDVYEDPYGYDSPAGMYLVYPSPDLPEEATRGISGTCEVWVEATGRPRLGGQEYRVSGRGEFAPGYVADWYKAGRLVAPSALERDPLKAVDWREPAARVFFSEREEAMGAEEAVAVGVDVTRRCMGLLDRALVPQPRVFESLAEATADRMRRLGELYRERRGEA